MMQGQVASPTDRSTLGWKKHDSMPSFGATSTTMLSCEQYWPQQAANHPEALALSESVIVEASKAIAIATAVTKHPPTYPFVK
jgi:hypothetical protein